MENSDKEQRESSGVGRELLNLQPTNAPGLPESVASSTHSRRRRQSTSLAQNRCAELSNNIKETLSEWEKVQLPLLPEDEEKLQKAYETLKAEKDELVNSSALLVEQLNKKGSVQEAKEVREVAAAIQQK